MERLAVELRKIAVLEMPVAKEMTECVSVS
jgi:hypothetical protein